MPTTTAIFGAAGVTSLTFSASPTSIGTLQFNAGAPAYTFTLNGQELDVVGSGITNASSNAPSFVLQSAGSFLYFKNSATAANATVTVNGGTVFFNDSSSGGTARLIVNAGGIADFSGLTGAGTSVGSIEGAGNLVLGSAALAVGGNNLTTTFSGLVSGAGGSVSKSGSGMLTLAGTNTYTGGTTFNAGTLSVAADANLGGAAGPLTFNGGALQVTGTTFTSTARTINWNAGGGTFDIANGANTFTVSQNLGAGGALTKIGAGTLTLSGTNSYTEVGGHF